MEISKYTGLFHDGGILNLIHINDRIEIWIESCEVLPEWNVENIRLSSIQTIRGILFIRKIKNITVNNIPIQNLIIDHDSGEISDINLYKDKIELFVMWYDYPPKKKTTTFECIVIEAECIEWENIPELTGPLDT